MSDAGPLRFGTERRPDRSRTQRFREHHRMRILQRRLCHMRVARVQSDPKYEVRLQRSLANVADALQGGRNTGDHARHFAERRLARHRMWSRQRSAVARVGVAERDVRAEAAVAQSEHPFGCVLARRSALGNRC